MNSPSELTSSQPYLIRAWHEWCTDNGLTPYVTVAVDASVQVPHEYVKDDEIVLNISYDSTTGLQLGNDYLAFKARFAGVARDVMVPVDRVLAIFARETGQGMAFPKASQQSQDASLAEQSLQGDTSDQGATKEPEQAKLASVPVAASTKTKKSTQKISSKPETTGRPTLTRIK
ncbi:MAG: ClpXP protease specificity-enhancing factor [Rhodoferax sp.]|nr:ClpXP protease specificity-enhancing factor [Rhodoferax sp.]